MLPPAPTLDAYRLRPPSPTRQSGGARIDGEHRGIRGQAAVSVVTVCYNSIRTLGRTLDSLLAQTYEAVELIVIDGGSSDGTLELLKRRSGDLAIWISEPDEGISDAFNKGIALATGDYIAVVNSDDWLDPGHLASAVSDLERTGADFVFGNLALHGADGKRVHFFAGEPGYAQRIAHYMPFINHPTVVCRRSAFEKIGLFDPALSTAMDYDWFLRLHNAGGSGRYNAALLAHMSLDGQSDRHFVAALREVREISVRHGYPAPLAWIRYAYRVAKGRSRRLLERWLPPGIHEMIRKRLNAQYRSNGDRLG